MSQFGQLIPQVAEPVQQQVDLTDVNTIAEAQKALDVIGQGITATLQAKNQNEKLSDEMKAASQLAQLHDVETQRIMQGIENDEAKEEIKKLRELELIGAQQWLAEQLAEGKDVAHILKAFKAPVDPENFAILSETLSKKLASSVRAGVNAAGFNHLQTTGSMDGFVPSNAIQTILEERGIDITGLDSEGQIAFWETASRSARNDILSIQREQQRQGRADSQQDAKDNLRTTIGIEIRSDDPERSTKSVRKSLKALALIMGWPTGKADRYLAGYINEVVAKMPEGGGTGASTDDLALVKTGLSKLVSGLKSAASPENKKYFESIQQEGGLIDLIGKQIVTDSVNDDNAFVASMIKRLEDQDSNNDIDAFENRFQYAYLPMFIPKETADGSFVLVENLEFEKVWDRQHPNAPFASLNDIQKQSIAIARDGLREATERHRQTVLGRREQLDNGAAVLFDNANIDIGFLPPEVKSDLAGRQKGTISQKINQWFSRPQLGSLPQAHYQEFASDLLKSDGTNLNLSRKTLNDIASIEVGLAWDFISNLPEGDARNTAHYLFGMSQAENGQVGVLSAMAMVKGGGFAEISRRIESAKSMFGVGDLGMNSDEIKKAFSGIVTGQMDLSLLTNMAIALAADGMDTAILPPGKEIDIEIDKDQEKVLRQLSKSIMAGVAEQLSSKAEHVLVDPAGLGNSYTVVFPPGTVGIGNKVSRDSFGSALSEVSDLFDGAAPLPGRVFTLDPQWNEEGERITNAKSYIPFAGDFGIVGYMEWDIRDNKFIRIGADDTEFLEKLIRSKSGSGILQSLATMHDAFANKGNSISAESKMELEGGGMNSVAYAVSRVQLNYLRQEGFVPDVDHPSFPDFANRVDAFITGPLAFPQAYNRHTFSSALKEGGIISTFRPTELQPGEFIPEPIPQPIAARAQETLLRKGKLLTEPVPSLLGRTTSAAKFVAKQAIKDPRIRVTLTAAGLGVKKTTAVVKAAFGAFNEVASRLGLTDKQITDRIINLDRTLSTLIFGSKELSPEELQKLLLEEIETFKKSEKP